MNSNGIFITGTDTGVGKTLVSAALLTALNKSNVRAIGMKPVASGGEKTASGWRNQDAQLLQSVSCVRSDYALVNPYSLPEAVAPNIAAGAVGTEIMLAPILDAHAKLRLLADIVVVEGVGGWAVPLSDTLMQADLVRALDIPVILVVGLRLGCLNHALLSAERIQFDGCRLLGWLGNRLTGDMPREAENVQTLQRHLSVPYLGLLPYLVDNTHESFIPALSHTVSAVLR